MNTKSTFYIIFLSIVSATAFSCWQKPCTESVGVGAQVGLISWNDRIRSAFYTEPEILFEREMLYNRYTLPDTFDFRGRPRFFQWDKIEAGLRLLDSVTTWKPGRWAVIQNKNNRNGAAPYVKSWRRNAMENVVDMFGVERYQSAPLYLPDAHELPARYGRDGWLVKVLEDMEDGDTVCINPLFIGGRYDVPKRYLCMTPDTMRFHKAIFIDRCHQIIVTLEKRGKVWNVLSMNPATTGVNAPPYKMPTPLGIFMVQETRDKMPYLKDGTDELDGFAPFASRFCCGAYIHGVPVALPDTNVVEYSSSLGTTPRSHMCVRVASSHAEFIYNWATVLGTVVFVIE
ncbi:MAG: L,D-transpeptidase [Rikenellaceae bacterium]|jgi:hypothetical protein|nr:L,D-transpeptidase [Rikenellaceae bacterium]